jgi:hypothetical protein
VLNLSVVLREGGRDGEGERREGGREGGGREREELLNTYTRILNSVSKVDPIQQNLKYLQCIFISTPSLPS